MPGLEEILGGLRGAEPEKFPPRERLVRRLSEVVKNARNEAKRHTQNADDAQAILDDVLRRDASDPLLLAMERVLI